MHVDAIVLAGARNNGKLRAASDAVHEATIDIAGQVMVNYVLAALKGCPAVERILVVGPPELNELMAAQGVDIVASGDTMFDNIRIGIEALKPKDKVLLVTSDIPLIQSEAISDFLNRCAQVEAAIYYPIVAKEVNEKNYPGVRRTYVNLKDGMFTGGNMVLLAPEVVYQGHVLIEKAINMRKKPWQLARLMGMSFLIKLLLKQLSIAEIEEQVSQVLGFRGVGVITPHPEVGIDVDKPSDLMLARRVLSKARK
ncbi:MAG TPA: NTP transferase domain-containing protein [Firmicutes bacterium]|nr:NTP transferase domain-containing protein [Bacillota bacterium]